jgi:hypothetical protein
MAERVHVLHIDNLAPDEIASPVMIYTPRTLSWGQLITKKAIRANVILRSTIVPDYLSLYSAHTIGLQGGELTKPIAFQELHIPTENIVGFHLMPPYEEDPDYDPDELNRKMEAVTVLVGPFFFHGCVRMSTQTDLATSLGVTKTSFTSLYDVDIVHMSNTCMKPIHVPMCQIRRTYVLFGNRL